MTLLRKPISQFPENIVIYFWVFIYTYSYISKLWSFSPSTNIFVLFFLDEFVVETVVSSNEILSDDPGANSRPFGDSSYGTVVSKGPIGLHNAYIAAGTFITAIFIVAIVVSTYMQRFRFIHKLACIKGKEFHIISCI